MVNTRILAKKTQIFPLEDDEMRLLIACLELNAIKELLNIEIEQVRIKASIGQSCKNN